MNGEDAIEELLRDFAAINPELTEILTTLRKLVHARAPELQEDIKYGGILFSKQKELLIGLFLRKAFVTMEFGFGYEFVDDDNLLEGSGKFRRHLKFRSMDDVEAKRAHYFIEQAITRHPCDE